MMMPAVDMTGRRIGPLVVLRRSARQGGAGRPVYWTVRCDFCQKEKDLPGSKLRRGDYSSCGCRRLISLIELNTTHGMCTGKRIPEYTAWANMKSRCYDQTNRMFPNYGGRGITVCDDWRDDFAKFFSSVGSRPTPNHSLDRIDNSRGYEPGNVRWANRKEQARNKRTTRLITFGGATRPLCEWAEITGLSFATIQSRLDMGWSEEEALNARPFSVRHKREQ